MSATVASIERSARALLTTIALAASLNPAQAQQQGAAPTVTFEPSQTTDAVTLVFGPKQRLVVQALLLSEDPNVAQPPSGGLRSIAEILGVRRDDPQLGAFSVEQERWAGARMCGERPPVALVLLRREGQDDRLAVISGALPGEPGSSLCAMLAVKVRYRQ